MSDAAILQSLLDDANERIGLLESQLSRRTIERDTLIQRIRYSQDHGNCAISTTFDGDQSNADADGLIFPERHVVRVGPAQVGRRLERPPLVLDDPTESRDSQR